MYLGCGSSQTDDEILTEFQQFYLEYGSTNPRVRRDHGYYAPRHMLREVGAPIRFWTEDQVGAFKATYDQTHTSGTRAYASFLAFLVLRGSPASSPSRSTPS